MPAVAPLIPSTGPRSDGPNRDTSNNYYGDNSRRYDDRDCSSSVRALFEQARQGLLDAEYAADPVERYARAYRAALRVAVAVLAARARPRSRARPMSAWTLLTTVAPELEEWSAFFAAASTTRAAAEAGARRLVTMREANDMVRQVGQFLVLAQRSAMRTLR